MTNILNRLTINIPKMNETILVAKAITKFNSVTKSGKKVDYSTEASMIAYAVDSYIRHEFTNYNEIMRSMPRNDESFRIRNVIRKEIIRQAKAIYPDIYADRVKGR